MPHPYFSDVPEQVPLPDAPLVKVLARVNYDQQLHVGTNAELAAQLQSSFKAQYPLVEEQQAISLTFKLEQGRDTTEKQTPTGESSSKFYRFKSLDGIWSVVVARDFVSLETTRYSSRADFVQRLSNVVQVVESKVAPNICTRVGVRYVDRVSGAELSRLSELVSEPYRGPFNIGDINSDGFFRADYFVKEQDSGIGVLNRWGLLPGAKTHDFFVMPPSSEPCWFLDIDASLAWPGKRFDSTEVTSVVEQLCARAYSVFRHVVTPQFIVAYGGKS
jgi:uncharacterized protein (TIGR04255 family)